MTCLEEKKRGKESTGEQNKGRKKKPTVVIKEKKKEWDNKQRQKDQCSPIHKLLNQINSHHYSGDFQHYCELYIMKYWCTVLGAPLQRIHFTHSKHLFLIRFFSIIKAYWLLHNGGVYTVHLILHWNSFTSILK